MIFRLKDMVGTRGCDSQMPNGQWARAVPLPFYDGFCGRLSAAWAVLRGKAYATHWPDVGEFERASNQ